MFNRNILLDCSASELSITLAILDVETAGIILRAEQQAGQIEQMGTDLKSGFIHWTILLLNTFQA